MTLADQNRESRTWRGDLSCRVWLVACVACAIQATAGSPRTVTAIHSHTEIPEASLLDVGIRIFDPGLPSGDESSLEAEGVFAGARKSEARYIPIQLMKTLQSTGHWGAVRILPAGTDSVDVSVSGEIVSSSGLQLALKVRAVDAAGRVWLKKKYKELADPRAYQGDEEASRDPFQNLYNRIANDLLAARIKRRDDELEKLRAISELRFASDLAFVSFADYLSVDRKGRTTIARLPAENDPMLERILRIRERDHMLIDTLTEYYVNFSAKMYEPYDSWRRFSYDEELNRKQLKRAARRRKLLGVLVIFGGALAGAYTNSGDVVGDAAVVGATAIKTGIDKSNEARLHIETLQELAASLDAEVEPLLFDVEGHTLRLTGSAEIQFATWRKLLRQIFVTETGLPLDPDGTSQIAAETQH